jgi:hypothetical protein
MIGIELQKQYERWQPRARYKHCLDPTAEDVRKLCISLRKNAKVNFILIFVTEINFFLLQVFPNVENIKIIYKDLKCLF